MAKVGTINVIGSIGADQPVSLRSVMEQVTTLGEVDSYIVNINSGGGEVTEGFAIYQYLTTLDKPITTRGIGLVGSIATVIFLAGDNRELYNNTQFLIHNPWTFGEGDADALTKKAEELRSIENQLLDFYVNMTGGERETLQDLMREDKLITSDVAHELKFATSVLPSVKAYATINIKNKNNVMKKIGKIFKDAFNALKENGVILNETVMTTDGMELEVTMAGDMIAVGDTVMVEGANANGVYTLADGSTITVVDGTITEMEKPSASVENSIMDVKKVELQKQIEELTAQITALQTENETLKGEQSQMIEEVAVITNHLRSLKVNVAIPNAKVNFNKSKEVSTELSKDDVKNRIKELQNRSKKKNVIGF